MNDIRGTIVQPRPSVDIEIGTVFKWADEKRPVVWIKVDPPDTPLLIHDAYIVGEHRPRRWWYLRSWFRVVRALWRMPFDPA